MPTFTAITLDRLLEPTTSSSSKSVPLQSTLSLNLDDNKKKKKSEMEKKVIYQVKASPLLYTTPEATPLPDDSPPVSFAPSPFIVNHKRRGPRLLKSLSVGDVSVNNGVVEEKKGGDENGKVVELTGFEEEEEVGGNGEIENISLVNGMGGVDVDVDDGSMSVAVSSERDYVCEDFFDPQENLSVSSSIEVEDNCGGGQALKLSTPMSEFFDAYEELSSEGGPQSSLRDIESELREMRLNLLMEMERRKQTEESVDIMRRQWESLREQLSLVGLTLPPASTIEQKAENLDADPAEELCRQIYLAREISASVGRGCAKAEVEMELESQIESKNFEIARLWDRLHYYEAMNHEMSQRNQEATEMARRNRQKRKQRQRWIWTSIGASVVLGSVALAWSYLPSGNGSACTDSSHTPAGDDAAEP